jgi:DNA-binding MurR/RpiR family transcriptional regulator
MKDTMFVRADEIAEALDVSRPTAYRLIKEMNSELKAKGFMTIAGRVSRQFFEERFYGISQPDKGG